MGDRRTTLCGYRVQLRGIRPPSFQCSEEDLSCHLVLQGDHKSPRHKALERDNSAGTSLSLQVPQEPVPVMWLAGDTSIGLAEAWARPQPPVHCPG